MTDLDRWDSPLADTVERLQDTGHDIYIWGWDEHGYALIIDSDKGVISIGHADTHGSLGRYENHKATWDRGALPHLAQRFRCRQ